MNKFNSKNFNAQAFGRYSSSIPNIKRNELIRSKALRRSSQIKNVFKNQPTAYYARLPMFGLLEGEAYNYDGQTDITAEIAKTYERGVIAVGRAKAWTESDFTDDITGASFMSNVASQVSRYWADIDNATILSILKGIFLMSGDENEEFAEKHTWDISDKENGFVDASTLNSMVQKASGDNKNKFTLAIMHSAVATTLENLQLLKYWTSTDKDGIQRELSLASWNGRTVLIDDSMPAENIEDEEGETEYTKYTTYVLGDGAFDYEDVGVSTPYEMYRDPSKNGGQDTLYTRQRKVFAPYGISYENKVQASLSPLNSELENGENWTLVHDGEGSYIDHKAIPIARIISRG